MLYRVGHQVPFPTAAQLGFHCRDAYDAMYRWSVKSASVPDTMRLAYVSGAVLLAGVVGVVRASGRGRRLNEPATLLAVATSTPVAARVLEFHDLQGLVVMGLSLLAVAAALRQRWV